MHRFFVTPSHQDSGTQIYTKIFLHCLTQRVNALWAKGGFLLMAKGDNSHWPTWSNSLGFSKKIALIVAKIQYKLPQK